MRILELTLGLISGATLCGCAEPLYLTEPEVQDSSKTGYVLVAPYFSQVKNRVTVSIVPSQSKDPSSQNGPPAATIVLVPVPVARSYLYFAKNSSFSNSFNVSVGSDGLLTSSDSTSVQQVSATLTEVAQTAAGFGIPVAPGVPVAPQAAGYPVPSDDRSFCSAGLAKLTSGVALYKTLPDLPNSGAGATPPYEIANVKVDGASRPKKVTLLLQLDLPLGLSVTPTANQPNTSQSHSGFIAYAPVPILASVICQVEGSDKATPISPPMVLNAYLDSRYVDPQRDFLTDPAETFTLTAGFLVGHKYSDQAGVKTVVDVITAPIRALFPTVSVVQTTQLQTGGGKPDQTTTTTQTSSGSSK